MTDTQRNKRPARRPDCVTETRIGNTILVVSGFFKEGATDTAADKMMKVLEDVYKRQALKSAMIRKFVRTSQ